MQWVVISALIVTFVVPTSANAYVTTYQTPAQQQQIAHLYALVAQLQAQLNALLAVQAQTGTPSNYIAITSQNVSDASNNSVQLYGTALIKQSGTARFWFEYGLTRDVSYSTESREVSNARSGKTVSFNFTAPDIDSAKTYYYRAVAEDASGRFAEGALKSFTYTSAGGHSSSNNSSDEPEATTDDATNIDTDSAKLSGSIDMNDYENGLAFLVYGESESRVEDASDEDRYDEVSTYGSDLRKVVLSTNLDSNFLAYH